MRTGELRTQNSETRTQNPRPDLGGRLLDYAAEVIKLTSPLQRTATAKYIVGQLVRAVASAGANHREARGAESTPDFVHKMQIVLKELREAEYWMMLLERAGFSPDGLLGPVLRETDELIRIVVKSVLTAKTRRKA